MSTIGSPRRYPILIKSWQNTVTELPVAGQPQGICRLSEQTDSHRVHGLWWCDNKGLSGVKRRITMPTGLTSAKSFGNRYLIQFPVGLSQVIGSRGVQHFRPLLESSEQMGRGIHGLLDWNTVNGL